MSIDKYIIKKTIDFLTTLPTGYANVSWKELDYILQETKGILSIENKIYKINNTELCKGVHRIFLEKQYD